VNNEPSVPAKPTTDNGSPTLTFRGGGWVLALAGLLVVLLLAWSLLPVILGHRPLGDGRSVESYGFDLSTLLVDRKSLHGSGNPRGFLPSLDDPKHLRGSEMQVYNEQNRPKFVVPTDRVIGIVVDGKPHAWPLTLMNAHEVVNDTVAGRPVVATYSPLCDAAMVFDRTLGGRVRAFEVSGLLYNGNLAFCDKTEPAADGAAAPDPRSPVALLRRCRSIRSEVGDLAASAAAVRSTRPTRNPSAASRRAMATPMSPAPPVTRARRCRARRRLRGTRRRRRRQGARRSDGGWA
jgi:hypothetical protein